MIQPWKIDEWFKRDLMDGVPEGNADQAEQIRLALHNAAHMVRKHMKPCAEQSTAIRKLREAMDSARRGMMNKCNQ